MTDPSPIVYVTDDAQRVYHVLQPVSTAWRTLCGWSRWTLKTLNVPAGGKRCPRCEAAQADIELAREAGKVRR